MFSKKLLNSACFYIIWFAKDITQIKYRDLYTDKDPEWFANNAGSHLWLENSKTKETRKATPTERKEISKFLKENKDWKMFGTWSLNAQGTDKQEGFEYEGEIYFPPKGTQWKTSYPDGLKKEFD